MQERVWAAIEGRRDEVVETVAALVRRPSLLGQEAAAQAYVAEHVRGSGMEADVWELDDALKQLPNAGESGVPFAGRPNVAGIARGAGDGRSLILNGHIDVVSPEPVAAWTHDPWGAEIVGDRMYGRGAFDMKSGVALNLFVARVLHDLGIQLAGDLIIHSVIEEECTGNGALAASLRHRADAALVTEPECGTFTRAHLGVMWFRVAIVGQIVARARCVAGRQCDQQGGTDHPGARSARRADERARASGVRACDAPDQPQYRRHSGRRLAEHGARRVRTTLPRQFLPRPEVAETRAAVEGAIHEAAQGDEWLRAHPPAVSYDGFQSSGSVVAMAEPSVQTLAANHRRVFGAEMPDRVQTSICDMRYYNFVGIPAGCYGATGANGHAADEWLDLNSLVPTAKVLAGFVLDWCGVAGE